MSDEHFGIDIDTDFEEVLAHYGILRKSGRYPWGSSGNETQRNKDFLDWVDAQKKSGLSEKQIADYIGTTTTELRQAKSFVKSQQRAALEAQVQRMVEKQMSNVAIGEALGINESSVRSLRNKAASERNQITNSTADMLRKSISDKSYIDIGVGTENLIGVTNNRLKLAVAQLQDEGYTLHYIKVKQIGTGKETTVKVLAPPGTPYTEVSKNRDRIILPVQKSPDGGRTFDPPPGPPKSLSSKRVEVRYAEQGGTDKDGVIEIRRGAKDLDLGNARYAQVRIAVDGTHYLKGMVVYADDLPPGVDVRFNTNKSNTGNKLDALKPLKTLPDGSVDLDNPFGAQAKPGGQRGVLNILREEGDWNEWKSSLSSQVLSKQSAVLAKEQLGKKADDSRQELDEILSLTNPTVRKKLLESYADGVDASAVQLEAAAMPRQSTKVLLPLKSIKETEIYAPNYENGERVSLVRFPHGGTFEIPELTVNNRNKEAKATFENAFDAVGINPKVASRLSGADFDGDHVIVIPHRANSKNNIKSTPALQDLKGYDPQSAYPAYDGMRTIDGGRYNASTKKVEYPSDKGPVKQNMQHKMGDVSNLITDMTIRGATESELARAVKHSMVVIDAEKHKLNYQQSYIDQGIPALKEKYQEGANRGAATLISRASSEVRVADRRPARVAEGGPVDLRTGAKRYVQTGATYVNKDGKTVPVTVKSTKMAETKDARTLISRANTPIEHVYADHANRLKGMANEARLAAVKTPNAEYNPTAAKTYAKEVASLNHKLNIALKNAPVERQAQLLANATVAAKREQNPHMDKAELKKVKAQALARARTATGAGKLRIDIGWDEWNAIQAGAVSNSKLSKILDNADLDVIKKYATPREATVMTDAKIKRAQAMMANGATQADIARALGVSPSTLNASLKR